LVYPDISRPEGEGDNRKLTARRKVEISVFKK